MSAKANQLINRIVQEGEYTNADILLTQNTIEGYLQIILAQLLKVLQI